jgi:hypothetical protein
MVGYSYQCKASFIDGTGRRSLVTMVGSTQEVSITNGRLYSYQCKASFIDGTGRRSLVTMVGSTQEVSITNGRLYSYQCKASFIDGTGRHHSGCINNQWSDIQLPV